MKKLKVAIIGAGTAGLTARRQVAKETDNYLVFDDGPLGTTCARVGCMPSKVLIEIANTFHRRHSFEDMGIKLTNPTDLQVDTGAVMRRVRQLRDRFVKGVMKDMEEWSPKHLVKEKVEIIGHSQLRSGKTEYEVEQVIIAAGSKPIINPDWMKVRHLLVDTDEFFELETLPKKMAVIGLGVIGIELGQALSRLGVEIYGITIDHALGGLTDSKIQQSAIEALGQEFPIDDTGVKEMREVAEGNAKGKLLIRTGKEEVIVDSALVAVGRRPNLSCINPEKLTISTNTNGIPLFETGTYRIAGTNFYLVGDVNGERPLLHEASDEGRIAGFNSLADDKQCFRRRASLAITFTDPNIALVGSTHKQLTEEKVDFVVGAVSFRGQGRAIVKHKEVGDTHVYVERATGRLLGAEIFSPDGEHHAHLLAWAIETKLTVQEALAMPFYHPVTEEGLRTALRSAANLLEKRISPLELMRCSDPPIR